LEKLTNKPAKVSKASKYIFFHSFFLATTATIQIKAENIIILVQLLKI